LIEKELLRVKGLRVSFALRGGHVLKAVDGVDLAVREGEVVGLVGESGCGKTVLSTSLLRLIDQPGRIDAGEVLWRGEDLLSLSERRMRQVRGREIAMIFQNPQLSLNPVYPIGKQMISIMSLHRRMSKRDARDEAIRLLRLVRIPDAERRVHDYPHQFSGGMCQRIMIAMALSCQPKLLIADEPTAALDVTIQAQIMDLLMEVRERFGMSILLISHDLALVSQTCDRVAVMYLGRVVETGDTREIIEAPAHPYTKALLQAVPVVDPHRRWTAAVGIEGDVPSALDIPAGCRFRSRCPSAFEACPHQDPALLPVAGTQHLAACLLHQGMQAAGSAPEPLAEAKA
jgi:oligopeptide/dipeptide ABC transporter ATP-binding protein